MKDKIVLLIAGCFALILSSCLGDGESYEYEFSKDAQVYKFHLKSDSIPKLDTVKFTIDQNAGADGFCPIYNIDSMAYGTVLKEKVVCTFETKGVVGIQVIQYALKTVGDASKDTIWWNASDSLDFSKPVEFITYAQDGITKKKYLAEVRIHQVLPDSMVWQEYAPAMLQTAFTEQTVLVDNDSTQYRMYARVNGVFGLYTAPMTAPQNWASVPLTNFPSNALVQQMKAFNGVYVVPTASGELYQSANASDWTVVAGAQVATLLGVLVKAENAMLCIINKDNQFATTTDLLNWKVSVDGLPAGFPTSGFGSISYTSKFKQANLVVVAGKHAGGLVSTVWGTTDGLYWIDLTNDTSFFTPREGVMLTAYDGGTFYLIGGLTASGMSKEIYVSSDYGKSWWAIDAMKVLPDNYEARAFGSALVNKENYLFIFGGKTTANGTCLDQSWRGRINRLGFLPLQK